MAILNIIRNLKKRGWLAIMASKVAQRFFDRKGLSRIDDYRLWLQKTSSSYEDFAKKIDPSLFEESEAFSRQFEMLSQDILKPLKVTLGGGGHYNLLYFLTRLIHPAVVVETGVSAGFSSQAILKAMAINNFGKLYSSDFPLFRYNQPEQYIGILVEDKVKVRWELFIDGDRANLPKISERIEKIDIFHYDSDKRYSGRKWAIEALKLRMTKDTIIIMDDIQDNRFFQHLVDELHFPFHIFAFEGKFVGLIGEIKGYVLS